MANGNGRGRRKWESEMQQDMKLTLAHIAGGFHPVTKEPIPGLVSQVKAIEDRHASIDAGKRARLIATSIKESGRFMVAGVSGWISTHLHL